MVQIDDTISTLEHFQKENKKKPLLHSQSGCVFEPYYINPTSGTNLQNPVYLYICVGQGTKKKYPFLVFYIQKKDVAKDVEETFIIVPSNIMSFNFWKSRNIQDSTYIFITFFFNLHLFKKPYIYFFLVQQRLKQL